MGKNDRRPKECKKSEKHLDHGTVVLNTVWQKRSVHNTLYNWRVPKYSKLKRYAMYYQVFDSEDVKCVFKLFKTNSMLYLCVRSKEIAGKKAQFYVMSETQQKSLFDEAKEIHEGLFSGEFKYELFEDPELEFLADDVLTVSFRYVSGLVNEGHEKKFDGKDFLSDFDELSCDLKRMYLESMYPDFEIKVQDYVFKVHKFVLAVCSDFFKQCFKEDPDMREITLDTVPGTLHEVLVYLYSGELNDMDGDCINKVVDLLEYLEIDPLIQKCYMNGSPNAEID